VIFVSLAFILLVLAGSVLLSAILPESKSEH
jgi:hypothetical protein